MNWKKLKAFAPELAAVGVAVGAGVSLSGYTAPVYAVEEPEPIEEEEPEPVKEIQKREKKGKTLVKGNGFDKGDGTYTGTGTGFRGTIKVSVQIKDRKITAIDILECADDGGYVSRAEGVIQDIIAAQSLEVDTVSGATFSSRGILRAVKNALTGETDNGITGVQEVGEPGGGGFGSKSIENVEEPEAYKDGVYTGEGLGFGGTTTVQVTVKGGKITDIEVLSHGDGGRYMDDAKTLIPRIIESQSTNVDTVSGASYSSVGIIEAVRNALKDAGASKEEEPADAGTGKVPYKEGIYYGTGTGYQGDLKVAVVIQDKTIKAILVVESEDDDNFLSRAKNVAEQVVKKQSTQDVDLVSGATFSSRGILEAIQNALKAAEDATNGIRPGKDDSNGKDDNNGKDDTNGGKDDSKDDGKDDNQEPDTVYQDGQFTGSAPCVPDEDGDFLEYTLTVKITIKNDKIVSIDEAVGDGDNGNKPYIYNARRGLEGQITATGDPDAADVVSGATCSSKALKEACRNALESARKIQ